LRKVDISIPEMPEVETMVERLQRYSGKTISAADIENNDRYLRPAEIARLLGQRIGGVFRRGKFIIFMLDRGSLLCHNAMSGYWDDADDPWSFDYVEGGRAATESDVRASFIIHDPTWPLLTAQRLRFHDSRKFGQLRYLEPDDLALKLSSLGPEAVGGRYLYEPSAVMTEDRFIETFQKLRQPIKAALMDQSKIAGIGNIYASEACWSALVDPRRPANDLDDDELDTLFACSKAVLRDALDRKLDYSELSVYRRNSCDSCGSRIVHEKLKGRSTYYCPRCQK
jgi:formamidopyrimidine-DNA glycosylase